MAVTEADVERQEIYFSGHVQGVGFRYSARQIAQEFDVAGYVENLSDGRVHLVVEGSRAEVKRFLNRLEVDLSQFIRTTTADTRTGTGEFSSFSNRH